MNGVIRQQWQRQQQQAMIKKLPLWFWYHTTTFTETCWWFTRGTWSYFRSSRDSRVNTYYYYYYYLPAFTAASADCALPLKVVFSTTAAVPLHRITRRLADQKISFQWPILHPPPHSPHIGIVNYIATNIQSTLRFHCWLKRNPFLVNIDLVLRLASKTLVNHQDMILTMDYSGLALIKSSCKLQINTKKKSPNTK